jgi:hypothetical protein
LIATASQSISSTAGGAPADQSLAAESGQLKSAQNHLSRLATYQALAHSTPLRATILVVNSSKTYDRTSLAPDERNTGWQWPTEWQWPTDFRKFMSWIFLATSLRYITISLKSIPSAVQQSSLPLLHILLMAPTLSVLMALVSGMASWTISKGKPSAKGWAIAASLIYVLIFLRQFIIPLRPNWDHHLGALLIGIVGLVAFLWPDKQVGE